MNSKTELEAGILDIKRGLKVYERNPSVPNPGHLPIKRRPVKVANGNKVMFVNGSSGEASDGHAAFFEMQEVDQQQFVKLYLAGIKQTAKLTAAGFQVFELVYRQMQDTPQTDKIELNHYLTKKYGLNIADRTYRRGLRELLENEFLYQSPSKDVYFVNINFMFNGNRITLAKSYLLQGTQSQGELALENKTGLIEHDEEDEAAE